MYSTSYIEHAKKQIRTGWIAGIVIGVLSAVAVVSSLRSGTNFLGVNNWAFFDVAFTFILAAGVYFKSRTCAVLLLASFALARILALLKAGNHIGIILAAMFGYFLWQGVIGTFSYNKAKKTQLGERRVRPGATMKKTISIVGFVIVAITIFKFWLMPWAASLPGKNPIHHAAAVGDLAVIRNLVSSGLNVNQKSILGTPLTRASHAGETEAVELLLSLGANPDLPDKMGWAPLHHTVLPSRYNEGALHALIKAHANIEIIDDFGRTPLHRAAQFGHTAAVIALLKAGAKATARDNKGMLPSQRAASFPQLARQLKQIEEQASK